MTPKVVIFLPMYNEAGCIGPLLDRLEQNLAGRVPFHVTIVDDGSSDGSPDVVRAHRLFREGKVTLHQHAENQGLGGALHTGVELLTEGDLPDDTVVITMDADNTHDPATIHDILAKLDEGKTLVIASRYQKGAVSDNVPWHRQVLSKGAYHLMRFMLPVDNVRDYSCGYRGYRLSLLRKAEDVFEEELITSMGFSCMVELLVKCALMGAVIDEVPIKFDYGLKEGASKIRFARTILGYLSLSLAMKTHLNRYKTDDTGEVWKSYWKESKKPPPWDYLSQIIYDEVMALAAPQDKILEAGSGTGRISTRVSKTHDTTMLDISPHAVETAREHAAREGVSPRIELGSVFDAPFVDGEFDLVWSAGLLEHFRGKDLEKIMAELGRITKPGGVILLILPFWRNPFFYLGKSISVFLGTWPYGYEAKDMAVEEHIHGDLILERVYSRGFFVPFLEGWRFFPLLGGITRLLRPVFIALHPVLGRMDALLSRRFHSYMKLLVVRRDAAQVLSTPQGNPTGVVG